MNDTCVIYARISLDAAGEGLGVERQESECRALAAQHGWTVTDVFVDNDISATTGKRRPEFERLLKSNPPRIVVWHTDRLVRLSTELERVIDLGVNVYAVTAGQLDLSSPTGRAVAKTITAWAQYEGEQKSLRQRSSHRQRAEQGRPFWGSRRPFGYNSDGTLHEDEAPVMKAAFEAVRLGARYADLARDLTDKGFTTTRGARWDGSRLSRTMRQPLYAGLIEYKGEPVGRGQWEPLVVEEEWRAILARSESAPALRGPQAPGGRVQSLLGGILKCGECGDPVRRTRQHSKRASGEVVYTYIYQPRCHHVSVNTEWADAYLSHIALGWGGGMWWTAHRVVETPKEDAAQEAAREAVRLRSRLDALAESFADGDITQKQLKTATAKIKPALAEAEARARTYYSQSPLDLLYGNAERTLEVFRSGEMTLDQQREVIQTFIHSATLRPRTNRNERANPSMFTVRLRSPNGDDAGEYDPNLDFSAHPYRSDDYA